MKSVNPDFESERPSLLVIIRHAESVRNKAKKGLTYFADENARKDVQGIPDHNIPLTEEGEQALKWADGQRPLNCGITIYDYNQEKRHLELVEYNALGWK